MNKNLTNLLAQLGSAEDHGARLDLLLRDTLAEQSENELIVTRRIAMAGVVDMALREVLPVSPPDFPTAFISELTLSGLLDRTVTGGARMRRTIRGRVLSHWRTHANGSFRSDARLIGDHFLRHYDDLLTRIRRTNGRDAGWEDLERLYRYRRVGIALRSIVDPQAAFSEFLEFQSTLFDRGQHGELEKLLQSLSLVVEYELIEDPIWPDVFAGPLRLLRYTLNRIRSSQLGLARRLDKGGETGSEGDTRGPWVVDVGQSGLESQKDAEWILDDEPTGFAGRARDRAQINRWFRGASKSVFVIGGAPGIGKSTLARAAAASAYRAGLVSDVFYCVAPTVRSQDEWPSRLRLDHFHGLHRLSGRQASRWWRLDSVAHPNYEGTVAPGALCILDDCGGMLADDTAGWLREALDSDVRVMLVGPSVPRADNQVRLVLDELAYPETFDLFRPWLSGLHANQRTAMPTIRRLYGAFGGHPAALQLGIQQEILERRGSRSQGLDTSRNWVFQWIREGLAGIAPEGQLLLRLLGGGGTPARVVGIAQQELGMSEGEVWKTVDELVLLGWLFWVGPRRERSLLKVLRVAERALRWMGQPKEGRVR